MYLLVLVVPPVQSLFMLVPAWVGPRPWIVVTSAFLHSGFLHVFFNMLTLYWVGSVVERAIGHWRYGAVCLISALGGSALVMLWCFVQPEALLQPLLQPQVSPLRGRDHGADNALLDGALEQARDPGLGDVELGGYLGLPLAEFVVHPGDAHHQASLSGIGTNGHSAVLLRSGRAPDRGSS